MPAAPPTPPAPVSPTHDALAPARSLPSSGPDDQEIISTPASRPRSRSGIVSFQSAPRKMPLIASKPPATGRENKARGSVGARPNSPTPAPQPQAASTIAAPLR